VWVRLSEQIKITVYTCACTIANSPYCVRFAVPFEAYNVVSLEQCQEENTSRKTHEK